MNLNFPIGAIAIFQISSIIVNQISDQSSLNGIKGKTKKNVNTMKAGIPICLMLVESTNLTNRI